MNTKMKNIFCFIALILSFVVTTRADLAGRINAVIGQPHQKSVQFSIHIIKADSAKSVYSNNAKMALIPASNIKIITTAAALKYLGPNYKYKTRIGIQEGSLVVIGSGDPLFGDKTTDEKYGRSEGWLFKDIVEKLREKNITAVQDIIVDSSVFDDQRVHPNWPTDQLNQWYACEVCGLNFNNNCIEMTVKNSGNKTTVHIEPKTNFIKIINKVIPVNTGNSTIGAYRNQEPNKIIVKGKCNKQAGPFDVAIERPAAFFGFMLYENLIASGINAKGKLLEKEIQNHDGFLLLAEYVTPIGDCLKRCNKNSLGLAAESLLKTIDAGNQGRKYGSWKGGQELITKYMLGLGISAEQFNIDDGSGLSRENKLSANALTKVLLSVYKSNNWILYKDSLAAGGIDGTIRKYFKEQKYKGKILGKTGYIDGVKSFSGICTTKKSDYIFSIIANKANALTRSVINDITKAIIDEADK